MGLTRPTHYDEPASIGTRGAKRLKSLLFSIFNSDTVTASQEVEKLFTEINSATIQLSTFRELSHLG